MERLDIPLFTANSSATHLAADGETVAEDAFREPGFERIAAGLRSLCEGDLTRQVKYIRSALELRYPPTPPRASVRPDPSEPDVSRVTPRANEQLIHAAAAIGEAILAEAVRGEDGSATWVTVGFEPRSEHPRLEPMGMALYDGRCGIALFMAALHRVTGRSKFRDLALAALSPLRAHLAESDQIVLPPRAPLGGANGLGSYVYCFTKVGELAGIEALIDEAGSLIETVTDERIRRDRRLDVIAGAAGTILGLLTHAGASGNDRAIDRATACGRHLVANRSPADGRLVWEVPWASRPLTGFGHGAAGISYALLRLYEATGEREFRDAASDGIAYETATYSEGARNWPDLRDSAREDGDEPRFMTGWCSGAPGIGLARLGGLRQLDTPDARRDIENALTTTLACPVQTSDHLCCGNVGRVDFLIEAARRLDRPELFTEAQRRVAWLVERAERVGHYALNATPSGTAFCPGLFQGTAGIGYQLLRLASPDAVPSVLLWA